MFLDPPTEEIAALLAQAGAPSEFHLTRLTRGANNRVYRVETAAGPLLLKAYFRHPDDLRDRLGAEFSFCRFAWEHGLSCVARPLACNRAHNLGLYEFIEGRALSRAEVGPGEVRQAVDFFRELNRHKFDPSARELPRGSEACFTLDEHVACVTRRLARLQELNGETPLGQELRSLVYVELAPAWEKTRERLLAQAADWKMSLEQPISRRDECISPSDFGFHNAIRARDGRLRFIDFEYAGWDDPAKMVCDFFSQPAIPVPASLMDEFTRAAVSDLSDPEPHLRRISLLRPVYQIKWCCILLNDFLPEGGRRRSFARQAQGEETRQRAQLRKAGKALRKLLFTVGAGS